MSNLLTPQSTVTVPEGPNDASSYLDEIEDLEFGLDFIEKSTRYREPFTHIWSEVLDNYMVVPIQPGVDKLSYALGLQRIGFGRPTTLESRARLKDPETHQIIESLSGQAMGLLMGTPDYLKAMPIGLDDPEKARLISRLLMAYLDQPGQYGVHYQAFKNSFTYGTSVLEFGWETRTRNQYVKIPTFDDATGLHTGFQVVPQEVVYVDQPLVREIDLFDYYPDPSGTRIQMDMKCVGKRFRITAADALRLVDTGVYDREPTYRALARIQGSNSTQWGTSNFDRKFGDLMQMPPDKYGMLQGFEIWGDMPLKRKNGSNRVITLLNGERVRGHLNPRLDGRIPFKEILSNPMSGRPYGLAPAEVIRFLQDSADNFLMIQNDLADLAIRGPMLVGNSFGGDIERLKERRVNDIITCRDVKQVAPVPIEFNALKFAADEMTRKSLRMREATGLTNPLQAIPGPVEKTATEASELVRLASQRVQMMVGLIERDDYPFIAKMIHASMRQFGSPDGFVGRVQGDVFNASFEDIDVDADVRFVGSDQSISIAQQNMNMNAALTLLAQQPQVVEQYPDLVIRYFRDILKIADAATIVQKAIQMSQVLQAREAAMGAAAPAGAPSPSVSTIGRPNTEASAAEQSGAPQA